MTCPSCTDGTRLGIQRIRTEGGVTVRTVTLACDCPAGQRREQGGLECYLCAYARCPDTPTRRLYLTGTPLRMNGVDREPNSPWFLVPSPEEVYGPEEGARLRAVGMGQGTRTAPPVVVAKPYRMRLSPQWTDATLAAALSPEGCPNAAK